MALIRRTLRPDPVIRRIAEMFKALSDPTRAKLMDALSHGELSVGQLAALVGLTPSAISHQLRLLRSLRLVKFRRAGSRILYSLEDAHITVLFDQCLEHVEHAGATP
ncbi:MAG: helix-turn-helix transcriptional regulator [Deltaproteobacteria bacterium]|nr:helix-turn-helix transcriptional regulator [Deltaproteobacteria bacterium]